VYRSSGAGDHGKEGILTFEKDHVCGPVCQEMGLDGSNDTSSDNSEEESEEDLLPRHKQHGLAWDPVREAAAGGR